MLVECFLALLLLLFVFAFDFAVWVVWKEEVKEKVRERGEGRSEPAGPFPGCCPLFLGGDLRREDLRGVFLVAVERR